MNERSYLYGYDRLNRLVLAEFGKLDTDNQSFDTTTGINPEAETWSLDLLGNWNAAGATSFHRFTDADGNGDHDGGSDTTLASQQHITDAANRIGEFHAFEEPSTSTDTNFYYDAAGNLVLDDGHFYEYDPWNHVAEVKDKGTLTYDPTTGQFSGSAGNTIATYDYDALGRRIRKMVVGEENPWKYFYYDGHRVIEQHEDGPQGPELQREFVYGLNYIDEPVAQYHEGGPDPHYVFQDANYNVIALTDSTGALEQQYSYRPYGEYVFIEDGNGDAYAGGDAIIQALQTPHGHQGLWFDPETGLYYVRVRYYNPHLGRWNQRDPNETGSLLAGVLLRNAQNAVVTASLSPGVQYADGMSPYQFVGSNSIHQSDPSGLYSYSELMTTTVIQGGVGGLINGVIARFAGRDFWEGFAEGSIGGALGGGLGFAFQASRAGFFGAAVLGRFVEGAAEEGATSFYSGEDAKGALVNAFYGGAMSVATGGLFSLNKREIDAIETLGAAHPRSRLTRRGSVRPAVGPGSFRDDLARHWGFPTPPAGYHAHHMFPLERAEKFRRAGIDPDNIWYGAWWAEADHLSKAKEYVARWDEFFEPFEKAGTVPSKPEVLNYGKKLAKYYGLEIAF